MFTRHVLAQQQGSQRDPFHLTFFGGWWTGGGTKHGDKTQFFEEASFFLSVLSVRVGQTPVTCPIDLKLKRPCAPTQPGLRGV